MTPRSSAELVESYIARLRAELTAAGAAEVDDLVAEVHSLLVDAAGDDPERAASEIAKFGEPAELAAGILAERGLTPEGGMSTADWWRMGIAVPIDITIGASVPIAAFLPFYLTASARGVMWAVPVALGLLFAASLAWPWYVWRPWRAGGSRVTAGMALTGIAVVRAPGFWRVVRTKALADMGLARPRGSRGSAALTILVALLIVGSASWFSLDALSWTTVQGWAERAQGGATEQRKMAVDVADGLYAAVIDGDYPTARMWVVDEAALPVRGLALLERRSASDRPVSYRVEEAKRVRPGLWTVMVEVKSESGTTYTDTVTAAMSLLVVEDGYRTTWVISSIDGVGLDCSS